MNILEVKNVNKQFVNHKALDDVSLEVPEGKIFGLLGPNGAGKTTLIRIINQITAPDSGEVLLNGKSLKREDIYHIGYLPEERGLYKKMTVGEQAIYLARLKGLSRTEAISRLKYWFEKFEIQAWWDKKVEELSKGMQQKVQFIVTILHKPKLLIFDEPFSGFDPINANLLKQEILDLKANGASVIFSTHNMGSVEEICDNIALINRSRKILEGSVVEVKQRFKTGLFECWYRGEYSAIDEALKQNFELVEHSKHTTNNYIKVKQSEQLSGNGLINAIAAQAEIVSFNEVIPHMDDIFIRVVNEARTQTN